MINGYLSYGSFPQIYSDNTYTMYVSGVGRRQTEMVCKTAGDAITLTLSTLQPTAGSEFNSTFEFDCIENIKRANDLYL